MRNRLPLLLTLVLLIVGVVTLRSLRVRSMERYLEGQTYEDLYYLPSASWLKALSLGYDEALADLVWMKALIYYGEEYKEKGAVRHVFHYADALLTLDPDFRRAYRWVGMAALYRPQGATLEDMKRATEYLERGVRRFPDDGELAWDLGASITYEILPYIDDPVEKESLRRKGVEHMLAAARLGAGPPWVTLSNVAELKRLGELEQAARHLEEMYLSIQDGEVREQIRRQLLRLRSESASRATRQAIEELRAAWLRDYPWLPVELYLLVSHDAPIDEISFLRNGFWAPDAELHFDQPTQSKEELIPPPSEPPPNESPLASDAAPTNTPPGSEPTPSVESAPTEPRSDPTPAGAPAEAVEIDTRFGPFR